MLEVLEARARVGIKVILPVEQADRAHIMLWGLLHLLALAGQAPTEVAAALVERAAVVRGAIPAAPAADMRWAVEAVEVAILRTCTLPER